MTFRNVRTENSAQDGVGLMPGSKAPLYLAFLSDETQFG